MVDGRKGNKGLEECGWDAKGKGGRGSVRAGKGMAGGEGGGGM